MNATTKIPANAPKKARMIRTFRCPDCKGYGDDGEGGSCFVCRGDGEIRIDRWAQARIDPDGLILIPVRGEADDG